MIKNEITAALHRIQASEVAEAISAGKEIITRMRIPHTRTLKQPGAIQFFWDPKNTRFSPKFVVYAMDKMGYAPVNAAEPPLLRNEFTNGTFQVLVAPSYGIIVVRPVGKEPLTASVEPEVSQEFDEYDDYDQWIAEVKRLWPKARHNKKGLPGYVPGYGEENDEEFMTGPDAQSDVVGVWNTNDHFGWVLREEHDSTAYAVPARVAIPKMVVPGCKILVPQRMADYTRKALKEMGLAVERQGYEDGSTSYAIAFELPDRKFDIQKFEDSLREKMSYDGFMKVDFYDLVED